MARLRKSMQRGSFRRESYLNRQKENIDDAETAAMLEFYENMDRDKMLREQNPEWQKNNLEFDLRSSDYIAEKCKVDNYAQNLYAALCNNEFIKNDVWPLLKEEKWSCSWRYAGGIIADIREAGDYIDWYCSGIRDTFHNDDPIENLNAEQLARLEISKKYVGEGIVTEEIQQDLLSLGWIVCDPDSNNV